MTAISSVHRNSAMETSSGLVWNRLHSEREDVCEALLKAPSDTNWHRELLQSRLRKLDNALDRLMSGSYGNCSKCGRWIEDTKLAFDPAVEFCIDCWKRRQASSSQVM